VLNDEQARRLSRTKVIVVVVTIFATLWLVDRGAAFGAMLSGGGTVMVFKLSELVTTYENMSCKQIATFVAITLVVQAISMAVFIMTVTTQFNGGG
jgi:hypothetical protein